MKIRYAWMLAVIFFSNAAVYAQQTQAFNVAGDGSATDIVLNPSEFGKEYALIAEIKSTSAVTVMVTISGPPGIVGKVFSKVIPASQSPANENLDPLYWKLVPIRYSTGNFKEQIVSGEDPQDSGGVSYQCPSFLGPVELAQIVAAYKQVYGPDITKQQVCAMLMQQLAAVGITALPGDEGSPDGNTPPARGIVQRDSCAKNYRYLVQFRINPTGLPSGWYTGLNAIHATFTVAPSKTGVPPDYYRWKKSDGRDAPSRILLTAAEGFSFDQDYGAKGTDTIYDQFWKNGKPSKSKKRLSRVFYGAPGKGNMMISKGYGSYNKKRTILVVNQDQAYSFCFKPTLANSCSKLYAKKTGIKCGPVK